MLYFHCWVSVYTGKDQWFAVVPIGSMLNSRDDAVV